MHISSLCRAHNKAGQVRHEARVDTLGRLKVSWSDDKKFLSDSTLLM